VSSSNIVLVRIIVLYIIEYLKNVSKFSPFLDKFGLIFTNFLNFAQSGHTAHWASLVDEQKLIEFFYNNEPHVFITHRYVTNE
jgi:hypothetical protein